MTAGVDPRCQPLAVGPNATERREQDRIARALAETGFVLPGSVIERMTRCGHANCRCHADPPQLHGPYQQWTRKISARTRTRIFSDEQWDDYRPWLDNERRLRSLVARLEALSLSIVERDPRWQR